MRKLGCTEKKSPAHWLQRTGFPLIDELGALARKYRELERLRARREAVEATGETFGDEELQGRRRAFRALAAEFPGALRELDTSRGALLGAKAAAVEEELAAVQAGSTVGRAWVVVVLDFHRTLAGLLARKAARADELLRLPGGRIMNLVWAELSLRHGLPREALEALVYGPQR